MALVGIELVTHASEPDALTTVLIIIFLKPVMDNLFKRIQFIIY